MLDWDDLRFFLAVARNGSLSAAARELRCTQSTVGRRLASLEAGLGVRLLTRTRDGYVVTPAGESVRDHAERVEIEALAIERLAAGQDAHSQHDHRADHYWAHHSWNVQRPSGVRTGMCRR